MRLLPEADLGVMYDAERANPVNAELIDHYGLTREQYIERLSKYPAVGFEVDGKCVGGLMVCGQRFHMSVLPEYYGKWGFLWKSALRWAFTKASPLFALVPEGNEMAVRFLEHCGAKRMSKRNGWLEYVLEEQKT